MFNPAPKPVKQEKKAKKSIAPKSAKRSEDDSLYSYLAKWWKKKKPKCEVCNVKATEDIHHKMGRQGVADEWGKWLEIPLLLDIRFWICVCRNCHMEIEQNPEWAKENGYSINRIK